MNDTSFPIYSDPSPPVTGQLPVLPPSAGQRTFLNYRDGAKQTGSLMPMNSSKRSFGLPTYTQAIPPKSARALSKSKGKVERSREARSIDKSSGRQSVSIEKVSCKRTDQKYSRPLSWKDTSSSDNSVSSVSQEPAKKPATVRKFDQEPLTWQETMNARLMDDCGKDIASYLLSEDHTTLASHALSKHEIAKELRCKMVDWMVEVLTNFKSQDQTLFLAISLMDRYFAVTSIKCTVVDLHLAGIISMFTASKLEDAYPLTLELAYNNIGHKRFTREELRIAEMKILSTMGWRLHVPTIYENILIHLELALPLKKPAPASYKTQRLQVQKLAVYLAMLTLHDYNFLTNTEASVIARACLRVSLKIKQACEGKTEFLKSLALFSESQFSQKLLENLSGSEEGQSKPLEASVLKKEKTATAVVQDLYFKFEKRFPGINNLRQLCKDVLPEKLLKKSKNGGGSSKKCLR